MSDEAKLNQMIELIQNNSTNSDMANQQILAEQNAIENSTSENEVGFWNSLITGKGRTEYVDMKEIPSVMGHNVEGVNPDISKKHLIPIASKLANARGNPVMMGQIFKYYFPEADISFDIYGTPMATITINKNGEGQEKTFYLNKAGFSNNDATALVKDIWQFTAGGKLGGWIGKGGGFIGKSVGAGVGMGGVSLARDNITEAVFEADFDDKVMHSAFISFLGTAGELSAPLIAQAINQAKKSKYLWDATKNAWTKQGKDYLNKIGVVADEWKNEFNRVFERIATKSINGKPMTDAQRKLYAESQSLASPSGTNKIDLTKGQVTQNADDLAFETQAKSGTYGDKAQQIVQGQADTQASQIVKAGEDTQAVLGGVTSPTVTSAGEGAERVVGSLTQQRSKLANEVDKAYDLARSVNVKVPKDSVDDLYLNLNRNINKDFGGTLEGTNQNFLKQLQKMSAFKNIKNFNVKYLEGWRQRVSKFAYNTNDKQQSAIAKAMIKQYDEWTDGVIQNAIKNGDDNTLAVWKDARSLRKKLAEEFETDKIINDLTSGSYSPEQTINKIFGGSKAGFSFNSIQALTKLKKMLTPAEFKILKEEAFLRLLGNQTDNTITSAQKFVTAFNQSMKSNKTVMNTLFNADEIAILTKLKNVLQATTPPAVGKGGNPSGTAMEIIRIIKNMFGPAGRVAESVIKTFGGSKAMAEYQASALKDAMKVTPKVTNLPSAITGATTSSTANRSGYDGNQLIEDVSNIPSSIVRGLLY